MATINVRLPEELKDRGDAVLSQEGISISEAIRNLYEWLDEEQRVPDIIRHSAETEHELIIRGRREAFESLTSFLPRDIDLDEVKRERIERKNKPGVRT